MTKQYEPKDYAHVLIALAEGKPVYLTSSFKEVPPLQVLIAVSETLFPPCDFHTEKPRPEIPIDAPIWVKGCSGWRPHHFSGWSCEGMLTYWVNGMTSHTAEDDGFSQKGVCYGEYSLTKPEGVK